MIAIRNSYLIFAAPIQISASSFTDFEFLVGLNNGCSYEIMVGGKNAANNPGMRKEEGDFLLLALPSIVQHNGTPVATGQGTALSFTLSSPAASRLKVSVANLSTQFDGSIYVKFLPFQSNITPYP